MRSEIAVVPHRSLLWCKPLGGHTDPERPFFGGRRTLVVVAGRKGDGKQQRKPKGKEEPAPRPEPAAPPPPRVDPNLGNITLQMRFAKTLAQARKSPPPAAKAAVAFRRRTKEPEEYKAERKEKEQAELSLSKAERTNFVLNQIHNTQGDLKRPTVVLVDGYNVIGYLNKSKGSAGGGASSSSSGGGSGSSSSEDDGFCLPPGGDGNGSSPGLLQPGELLFLKREDLVDWLGKYSSFAGVRVVVAFDAMCGPTGITDENPAPEKNGVTVVYCGDKEADSYLARAVTIYRDKGYKMIAVVSNDRLVSMDKEYKLFYHQRFGKQEVYAISVGKFKRDVSQVLRRAREELEERSALAELQWRAGSQLGAKISDQTAKELDRVRSSLAGAGAKSKAPPAKQGLDALAALRRRLQS